MQIMVVKSKVSGDQPSSKNSAVFPLNSPSTTQQPFTNNSSHPVWQLEFINRLGQDSFYCTRCKKTYKLSDRSPRNVVQHVQKKHQDEYKACVVQVAPEGGEMNKFVIRAQGKVTAMDKKVLHFIADNSLPFSIVESSSFKALVGGHDLLGRRHYSDTVCPAIYSMVKMAIVKELSACQFLSFTSDIWTNNMKQSFLRFVSIKQLDNKSIFSV